MAEHNISTQHDWQCWDCVLSTVVPLAEPSKSVASQSEHLTLQTPHCPLTADNVQF